MILAAGYGTRMRPLTEQIPKALMPLWNQSLLARNIQLLSQWGVQHILVNAHHHAEQVVREAMRLAEAESTARISVSFEPNILGTGGALIQAGWFFDPQPFWLINADVVAYGIRPAPFLRALNQKPTPLAACWLTAERGPRTVRMREEVITDFAVSDPGGENTYTFCGLHLLTREILRYLPEQPTFASIIAAYQRAQGKGCTIAGVKLPNSYWSDVGTPERYIETHAETAQWFAPDKAHTSCYNFSAHSQGNTEVAPPIHAKQDQLLQKHSGGTCSVTSSENRPKRIGNRYPADVCVAQDAKVHPRSKLHRCVIWPGAQLHRGAQVQDAVIGQHTEVSGQVQGIAVPADIMLASDEKAAVNQQLAASGSVTANLLPARGSARSYIRLMTASDSVMLMRYSLEREENRLFAPLARALSKAGWSVPRILAGDPPACWLLMEDVGDDSIQQRAENGTIRWQPTYERIVDDVLQLHGPVTRKLSRMRIPSMPAFGPAVYEYEHDLFLQHYVQARHQAPTAALRKIRAQLQGVTDELKAVKPVWLHRDLQSSNIHWVKDRPVFIDFQGLRRGPAAYDLASLLCDPYVEIPQQVVDRCVQRYEQSAAAPTFSMESYRAACVQRLCQALGAYGRLSQLPGCTHMAQYVPIAEQRLHAALVHFPALRALLERYLVST